MRTFFVESRLTHLKQLPEGPALGFGQIESTTYVDACRYLENVNPALKHRILEYCHYPELPKQTNCLIHNLAFNALIARTKYWMQPESIPSYKDVSAQAYYWKKYYNSYEGRGSEEDFIKHSESVTGWINHHEDKQ